MSTILMLIACVISLFIGAWLAWFRPDSLRRTLNSLYSDRSLARMASSEAAFWVARVVITIFFVIALGMLIVYLVGLYTT